MIKAVALISAPTIFYVLARCSSRRDRARALRRFDQLIEGP
jgi:hypothetical protein